MKFILSLLLLLTSLSFAGIDHAPPAFETNFGKAIFVDFIKADYDIIYDFESVSASVETTITFQSNDTGLAIFDSVSTPKAVWLNGQYAEQRLINVPGEVSKVRVVTTPVTPGVHTLKLRTELIKGTLFTWRGVQSGFFIKDLKDRNFLERYVPTNYEYDSYKMNFRVEIIGTSKSHNIFANGDVTELSKNLIEVSYPDFYTSSSVFFHLVPKSRFHRLHFTYTSINGNQFPVTIYSNWKLRNWRMKRKTLKVLAELENDYGPWPHPGLIIYGTKIRGGMEYVGATATSYISLGHELQHSYFAKGIMPADGNSGWMDEGIASWRDRGHKTASRPNYTSVNLAHHNVYTRKTDKRSYVKGRSFFAYIDYKLKRNGTKGFKDFLRGYFEKRKFTSVTTEDLIHDLEEYSGISFRQDFNQYIYGAHPASLNEEIIKENPHHPEYTEEELNSII